MSQAIAKREESAHVETNMQQAVNPLDMDVFKLGDVLSQSGYFSDAKEAAQCVVKVLAGRELGFGPVASMSGIHIIQGKPSLAANLMAAAIKRSGKYNYRVRRMDNEGCEIEFFEAGQPVGVSTFTKEDAQQAGALTGKNSHTWKAYMRNMLFARAISNGARWYCPDIFGGPVYTPEELNAPINEAGEVLVGASSTVEPRAIPSDTASGTTDAQKELRRKRAEGMAAMGLVRREGDSFVVRSASTKGKQQEFTVMRIDAKTVRCTCAEYDAAADPAYRCEHIMAATFAVKNKTVKEPDAQAAAQATDEHAQLDAEVTHASTVIGWDAQTLQDFAEGYFETDSKWQDLSLGFKRQLLEHLKNQPATL